MNTKQKVVRILAPYVHVTLVADENFKLELDLAWSTKAVLLIENKLRNDFGIKINVLQNPGKFWTEIDTTMLAVGVWACAQQKHWQEFGNEEGFETIASYICTETYAAAAKGLHDAFYEQLSDERKAAVKKAEDEVLAAQRAGEETPAADPTKAPTE